jgi:hypothetical protein
MAGASWRRGETNDCRWLLAEGCGEARHFLGNGGVARGKEDKINRSS